MGCDKYSIPVSCSLKGLSDIIPANRRISTSISDATFSYNTFYLFLLTSRVKKAKQVDSIFCGSLKSLEYMETSGFCHLQQARAHPPVICYRDYLDLLILTCLDYGLVVGCLIGERYRFVMPSEILKRVDL